MTEPFTTYYLIDGMKVGSYGTMQKRVLGGSIAVEVSAASQKAAAERRAEQAIANAILDAKIAKVAAQREHDQSPEGKTEAARRTAAEHPGGIVSGGPNPFAELDAYLPHRTSLLR